MQNPQAFCFSWPQTAVFSLIILSIGILIGFLAGKKWWIKEGKGQLWETILQHMPQEKIVSGAGISAIRGVLRFTAEWMPLSRKRRVRDKLKGIRFISYKDADMYRL
jgi:hypothetical protein